MVNRAFTTIRHNLSLIVAPVLLDIFALFLGLVTTGFWGEPQLAFKFLIDVGVPSISNILQQNVLAGGVDISEVIESDGSVLLVMLVFFFLGALIEGGFIGSIYEMALGEPPTVAKFISYAKKYWGRFLMLRLLISVVLFLGIIVAASLALFGLLAFTIAYIVFRIKYIYWEFTIVAEDLGVIDAFRRSNQHFKLRALEFSSVIILMLAVNFLAGLVFNLFWNPIVLFLGIFIYAYFGTSLQLALMYTKPGSSGLPEIF